PTRPTPAFLPRRDLLLPGAPAQRCFAAVHFLSQAGMTPGCFLQPVWRPEAPRRRVPAQRQVPRLVPLGNNFYSESRSAAVEAEPFVGPFRPISRRLSDRPR